MIICWIPGLDYTGVLLYVGHYGCAISMVTFLGIPHIVMGLNFVIFCIVMGLNFVIFDIAMSLK